MRDGQYPPRNVPAVCRCGAVLCRNISIQTGECQACRNERQGAGKSK